MRKRRLTFWTTLLVLIPLLLVSGIAQAQDGRRPAAKTSEDVPDLRGDDFGKGQKKARSGTDHENHPPTLSVRWDPPQPKLGKTVLNPNGRPSVMVIYAEGKTPGRSSKEKPDITHGWSTWKRSAK